MGLGPAPTRRLIADEFENAVRQIFGVEGRPASGWPSSTGETGFNTDLSGQGNTAETVEQMMLSAERVAAEVVTRLPVLLPCSTQTPLHAATCGRTFFETYGRRLFRRPLNGVDSKRLEATLTWALGRGSFPNAIRLVTLSLLQSPHFLYRLEQGAERRVVDGVEALELTPYELATRLSFALTSGPPDEQLLAAAADGSLDSREGIRAQGERLLRSADGRRTASAFFKQWLKIEGLDNVTRDPAVFTGFTPALGAAMNAGTEAFLEDAAQNGTVGDLFESPSAFVNALTAPMYGLTGISGSTLQRVQVTGHSRRGLLTDLGLLTQHAGPRETSPVGRGKFVYETLLCQGLPPPPPDADTTPPAPDPTLTTRERFAQHRANPQCAGCHALFDPPGFALEGFDAVGRFRTVENGKPIDASGSMRLEDRVVSFDGAVELAELLAKSELPRRCFERKWFQFVFGRDQVPADAYSLDEVSRLPAEALIRERMLAMVLTPSFLYRPAAQAPECAP